MNKIILPTILLCLYLLNSNILISQEINPEGSTEVVDQLDNKAWNHLDNDTALAFSYAKEGLLIARKIGYTDGEINCLNRKGNVFDKQGRFELAKQMFQRALIIAIDQSDNQFAIGRGYHLVAICLRKIGRYRNALDTANIAVDLFEDLIDNKASFATALANRGTIHKYLQDGESALADFHKSQEIYKELSYYSGIADIHNSLGLLYEDLSLYKSALEEHKKSLSIRLASSDTTGITSSYVNLGNIYFHLGQFSEARTYYELCFQFREFIEDKSIEGGLYQNLGILYQTTNQKNKALDYLKKSLEIRKSLDSRPHLAESYKALGVLNYQLKEFDKAKGLLEKCLEVSDNSKSPILRSEAALTLAYVYGESNDATNVIKYFQESTAIKDSLVKQAELVKDFEIRYERSQADLAKATFDNKRKTILSYSFGAGLILLLIIGLFIILWLRSRQKVIESEVMTVNAILKGKEKEQERIGRDLHDHVVGILSMVQSTLKDLDSEWQLLKEEREMTISKARSMLGQAIESVREISHDLGSSLLRNLGLEPALEELATNIEKNHLITVNLHLIDLDKRLTQLTTGHVYNIIRELTNNTIKYANADVLTIQVIQDDSELTVMVEDDGIGFDTSKKSKGDGFGFLSIESRLKELNGNYQLDSTPQKGTTVIIHIPLHSISTSDL